MKEKAAFDPILEQFRSELLSLCELQYRPWSHADDDVPVPVIVSDSTIACRFGASGLCDMAVVVNGEVRGRILAESGSCFSDGLGELVRCRLGPSYTADDFAVTPMRDWGRESYPVHERVQEALMRDELVLPCLGALLPLYRQWMQDPAAEMMQRRKGKTGVHMVKSAVDFLVQFLLWMDNPLNIIAGWNAADAAVEFRMQLAFAAWALRNA